MPSYQLTLHKTYYNTGFFNLGVDVDRYIRKTNGPIKLRVGASQQTVDATVNREANTNGTPRIMGGVQLRDWLHRYHKAGDKVVVEIITPEEIWLHA